MLQSSSATVPTTSEPVSVPVPVLSIPRTLPPAPLLFAGCEFHSLSVGDRLKFALSGLYAGRDWVTLHRPTQSFISNVVVDCSVTYKHTANIDKYVFIGVPCIHMYVKLTEGYLLSSACLLTTTAANGKQHLTDSAVRTWQASSQKVNKNMFEMLRSTFAGSKLTLSPPQYSKFIQRESYKISGAQINESFAQQTLPQVIEFNESVCLQFLLM